MNTAQKLEECETTFLANKKQCRTVINRRPFTVVHEPKCACAVETLYYKCMEKALDGN